MVVYDVYSNVFKNRNVNDGKLLPKCDNDNGRVQMDSQKHA